MRNTLVSLLLLGLLSVGAVCQWQLIDTLSDQKDQRTSLAELNHIRFGLLNADAWVARIAPILSREVETLWGGAEQQITLRRQLRGMLDNLLTREKNRIGRGDYGLIGGVTRSVCVQNLQRSTPQLANDLADWLTRAESREALQDVLGQMLSRAAAGTSASPGYDGRDVLMERLRCSSPEVCAEILEENLQQAKIQTVLLFIAVLVCLLAVLLLQRLLLPRSGFGFAVSAAACLTLLLGGLFTPMLDVSAQIDSLSFQLASSPVTFNDQVLYFQSKSISDLVEILVGSQHVDLWLVGVLMLIFCVAFPFAKLVASVMYVMRFGSLGKNPLVRYLALQSGKWSMADVMVVSILMAYIGFDGMLGSQIESLNTIGGVQMFASHGTTLRPGFYLFLAFCLVSMYLSSRLPTLVGKKSEI